MTLPVVRVTGVTKRFRLLTAERTVLLAIKSFFRGKSLHRAHTVLENVSFEVHRGECVALLGGNGAGKSTLLRLITGILSPTTGVIETRGESSGVFAGETGLFQELSVVENIPIFGAIHGINRDLLRNRRSEILEQAGLKDLRFAMIKELSSGQRRRLALSIFFQCDHDFIVLDEALAHVDASFQRQCEERIAKWKTEGRTILVVSHDLDFVRRKCDRAIWLSNKTVRAIGPVEDVLENYEKEQNAH